MLGVMTTSRGSKVDEVGAAGGVERRGGAELDKSKFDWESTRHAMKMIDGILRENVERWMRVIAVVNFSFYPLME
ncbi:hypothetical protein U1Q18_034588 [Sarracenia purpurea var. burkii]